MGKSKSMGNHHSRKNGVMKKRRRAGKHIDQIFEEMQVKGTQNVKRPYDPELPGGGQFFCIHCDRHFISKTVLQNHFRTKPHKKRVKELKAKPYLGPDVKIDNGKRLNENKKTPMST
eukprot:TRINITY_DN13242_c0_g1_i1.p1 TRINITY_DN13242_c0_g1~~TRINITY_DN13242_c0_g1_i1.p1  ORF type:complete len:117 (+),score=14.93 TRINITY_DN13242_c0_g1_i1:61-411(+)